MKRHKLIQRLTAALVAGAMTLSLSAPALAAAPSAAADPAAPAATASTAENSTADTIVFDQLYLGTQEDWTKTIEGGSSGDVALQYTAADRTLTVTGTYFRALTISAPGVNVVLTGTTGPAVKGNLTITASASVAVTSSAAGAQAVTGSTDITSDGAVSIIGADRAVGGENLTVNAGDDVTIVGGCEGASIWHSASITTTGSVTLTTNNSGGWAQGTAGTGVLTVDAGGDITITGGTANQPTVNDATVRCGGEFELRNPAGGLVLCNETSDGKSGNLHYYNTGATELVFRASSMGATCDVFQPGDSTVFGTLGDPSWITAKHEQSYQLTLTGCASADSAQGRTVFYPGEEVHLVLKRPTNGTTFTGWTVTKADGTAVPFAQEDDSIRFTMPACAVTAAANWEQATGQALWLSTEQDWIIVSKASLEADPISGITYEDGTFIVDGIKAAKTLRVLGLAPTEDERPDVVLKGLTVDTLIVDGVRDVTLDACRIGELNGYDHFDTVYSLQITNARDVVLTDTSIRYSDLSGVRNVTAKADGTLCDRLNIKCTGDIELSTAADTLGVACRLQAGGSIRLTGTPRYDLWVSSAQNVTVDANALPQHASFTCSGIVDITQRDGSAIVEWDSDAAWYLLEYYPETEQPYVVTLNGETGEVRSALYQLDNLDDLRAVQHLLITPTSLPPDDADTDAVGQFTDASGVLVSAALAGAAVWGGYEVTTRVMLKNLLPEGAAIPATRGELALLLWNAAGRPEAGAVVTVYPDITDADQQAAARWCTEQGLLTARSDGTFAPDGRVPKWRVIEVWNHAFAK